MAKTFRAMVVLVAMASTLFAVAGCSTPRLPNSQTASEQFSRLGTGEKRVAMTFYDLGAGDEIKRLYWAQRRAQETGGTASTPTSLQRKYVVLPVPEHVDPDGTVKEASNQVVEVVQ